MLKNFRRLLLRELVTFASCCFFISLCHPALATAATATVAAPASATATASARASASDAGLETVKSLGAITSVGDAIAKDPTSPIAVLVDENDCQRKIMLPGTQPPLSAGDSTVMPFRVEVTGAGCPITYLLELKGTQLPQGFRAEFVMKYEARSAESKALYDIDKSEVIGVLEANAIQNSSGGGLKAKFNYTGTGHSQTFGDYAMGNALVGEMKIQMSTSGGGAFPEVSIKGQFDDVTTMTLNGKTSELKSVTVFDGLMPKASYFINGTVTTEVVYKQIRDTMRLPTLEQGGPGSSDDPMMSCTVSVFTVEDLSVGNANAAIRASKPIKALPLAVDSFCGTQPKISLGSFGGNRLTVDYQVKAGYLNLNMQLCGANQSCAATDRGFQFDDEASYADALLNYTVLSSCKAVAFCGGRP